MNREMTAWMVSLRTVVIDGFIKETIESGADAILNLGAGLDARPYRLDLPKDLLWIEADYPDVISYKEDVLAGDTPRGRLERVSLDLANDEARRSLLSTVQSRSRNLLVLTEGVIPYLENKQAGMLADDLHGLAATITVSWIVECFPKRVHYYRRRAGMARQMKNAPFKFRPDDWFAFFAGHGWKDRTIRYLGTEGIRLGRRAPLSWKSRMMIRIARLFRRKRGGSQLDRLLGYAMLDPVPIKHD